MHVSNSKQYAYLMYAIIMRERRDNYGAIWRVYHLQRNNRTKNIIFMIE